MSSFPKIAPLNSVRKQNVSLSFLFRVSAVMKFLQRWFKMRFKISYIFDQKSKNSSKSWLVASLS